MHRFAQLARIPSALPFPNCQGAPSITRSVVFTAMETTSLPTPERVAELRASLDDIRDRVGSAVSHAPLPSLMALES